MVNRLTLLFLSLSALPLAAQSPPAGALDTVAIPGTEATFEMVYVPGGKLMVGETAVELDGYWIGRREVSQGEYSLFQHRENDSDASSWKEGEFSADAVTRPSPPYTDITFGMGSTAGFPAVSMTQQAALFYCYWLYTKTGEFYRLPTEAEWTYACLGGSGENHPEGLAADALDDYAWHFNNSSEKFHEVAQKKPTAGGLYDMLGNVAEWTLDKFEEDYAAAAREPNPWIRPESRYGRTVMGGSYDDDPEDCHCRSRVKSTVQWQKRDPQIPKSLWWNTDAPFVGFRVVRPLKTPSPEEIEAFFAEAIKW